MAITFKQLEEKQAELSRAIEQLSAGQKNAYKKVKALKKIVFSMRHDRVIPEKFERQIEQAAGVL